VFLDKHQMKVIVLAVLLAIGTASYVVYEGIQRSGEETAGALLAKAEDISDLQGLVKNHAGTAAAYSAKVLLAEKQWEDGQQDDSVGTLKAFIEGGEVHPALASAKASLASKLLTQGKQDEAEEMFRDLAEDPDSRFIAPFAWISIGDIKLAKGDSDGAAKAYDMVEEEFPGSPFSQDATMRGLLMKANAPAEVAAPITVPDVEISPPPGDLGIDGLIKAAGGGSVPNPLIEEPKVAE
jgi:predicted negative regulator of RcsB-dependent stress response